MGDVGLEEAVGSGRCGVVQQAQRPIGLAGQPGGVGGEVEPSCSWLVLGRQQRSALEHPGRRHVTAAVACRRGRGFEPRGDLLVGLDAGCRRVPGPPLRVFLVVREAVRERLVRGAPLGRRRLLIDRRSDERMTEADLAVLDREQARVLALLEARDARATGARDHPHRSRVRGRGEHQRPPSFGGEAARLFGKDRLQALVHGHRMRQRLGALQLRAAEAPG